MKLTHLVIEKLLNDREFRLNTALALKVGERNIQARADENADNGSLTKMAAVNYYKSTGLSEEQIFEVETAK